MYIGIVVVVFSIVKRLFYLDFFVVYFVCNKVFFRFFVERKVKRLDF